MVRIQGFLQLLCERASADAFVFTILQCTIAIWGAGLVLVTIIQVLQPNVQTSIISQLERDRLKNRLRTITFRITRMSWSMLASTVSNVLGYSLKVPTLNILGLVLFLVGVVSFALVSREVGQRYITSLEN